MSSMSNSQSKTATSPWRGGFFIYSVFYSYIFLFKSQSNQREEKWYTASKEMNWIKKYIEYLKDNPQGYWFKRKLYGWGWTPVKWQGWLVVAIAVAIFAFGIYVGETDDAPGATLLGFLLMFAIIFFFGYKKGEKPRWQWGLPKDHDLT